MSMFIWNICDDMWRINKKGLGAMIKLTQSFLFDEIILFAFDDFVKLWL